MEAKDTVMTDEQINKVEDIWLKTAWNDDNELPRMIAKAQAELSFKAGAKEVVEWIEANKPFIIDKAMIKVFGEKWGAKLKEWEVEKLTIAGIGGDAKMNWDKSTGDVWYKENRGIE